MVLLLTGFGYAHPGRTGVSKTPPPDCSETQGQVFDSTFRSLVGGNTVPYRVYLPPCYTETNRRYPYVILLHGAGNDDTQWTEELGVNKALDQGIIAGSLPPMVLIMPTGGYLEYENLFVEGGSFESLVMTELLPEIENNLCVLNTRAGRALAGISRGGFWVFEIGLRHPEAFSALAGHSAYFDSEIAPPANNPLSLAQSISSDSLPRLWLDVAADDVDTRAGLDQFAQILSARHITSDYTVYPEGGHQAAYWQAHLTEYLSFYGQDWPLHWQDLPACH